MGACRSNARVPNKTKASDSQMKDKSPVDSPFEIVDDQNEIIFIHPEQLNVDRNNASVKLDTSPNSEEPKPIEEFESLNTRETNTPQERHKKRQKVPKVVTIKYGENVHFFRNERRCRPEGEFIEKTMAMWKKDENLLVKNPEFIYWIFPSYRTVPAEYQAVSLTPGEAELLRTDIEITTRILRCYKIAYEFFGLTISDITTGAVARNSHFEQRFHKRLAIGSLHWEKIVIMLTNMYNVGFHRYAWRLVEFIKNEVEYAALSAKSVREKPIHQRSSQNWSHEDFNYGNIIVFGAEYSEYKPVLVANFCISSPESVLQDSIFFSSKS